MPSKVSLTFTIILYRNMIAWSILYASPKVFSWKFDLFILLMSLTSRLSHHRSAIGVARSIRLARLHHVSRRLEYVRSGALSILHVRDSGRVASVGQVAALLALLHSIPTRRLRAFTVFSERTCPISVQTARYLFRIYTIGYC